MKELEIFPFLLNLGVFLNLGEVKEFVDLFDLREMYEFFHLGVFLNLGEMKENGKNPKNPPIQEICPFPENAGKCKKVVGPNKDGLRQWPG